MTLFDALFDGLNDGCTSGCSLALPALEAPARVPAVDIRRTDKAYLLEMELPGKTQDDITITVKEGVLTIASAKAVKDAKTSETDSNAEKPKETYLLRERYSTAFERSFRLSDTADGENITASLKNGLLEVTIPLKEKAAERKITIEAA